VAWIGYSKQKQTQQLAQTTPHNKEYTRKDVALLNFNYISSHKSVYIYALQIPPKRQENYVRRKDIALLNFNYMSSHKSVF
jgi:hypothetical protein